MPKHNIYPAAEPDAVVAERRIELHWQREMYVQIATTVWKGEPGKPDTGQELLPGATDTIAEMPRAWDGQFVDLNRDQINHLIKQLRVARDQAFGRDE